MAHRPSRSPSSRPHELSAAKAVLDQRWQQAGELISRALALPSASDRRQLRVEAEYQQQGVWAGLQGGVCEPITRNRGGQTWVAPFCEIPSNLLAWLSWQETWEIPAGQRNYRFKTTGLSVYLGKRYEAVKPQLLRLEWPGYTSWKRGQPSSFQSPGAGHPHWQIDLVQSLASIPEGRRFEPVAGEVVEDFEQVGREQTVDELVRRFSVERMHLASAASWWLPTAVDEVGHHMNAPPDLASLDRWLGQSIVYLRQELGRCVIHA